MKENHHNHHHHHSRHSADPSITPSNAILSHHQVERLENVLKGDFEIHGRGNFPTLVVCLRSLIREVRAQMMGRGFKIKATKLNGGVASHILATSNDLPFSDVDLIYSVTIPTDEDFDHIKDAVLDSLTRFLPSGASREKISRSTLRDAYIRKMVKVREGGDHWSLFALNNDFGKCIELKFVDQMRRQFEFSVDSFQIHLDPLLEESSTPLLPPPSSNLSPSSLTDSSLSVVEEEEEDEEEGSEGKTSPATTTDSSIDTRTTEETPSTPTLLLPTVSAESMYGDFRGAIRHLNERLIDTTRPEEIRGGGLLKYCHLLVRGYRAARPWKCKQLERYMCSRFFIDFPGIASQELKLCSYLDNHLGEADAVKYEYLLLLYRIVSESTVCLMSHERRQTLAMIDRLAYQLSLNMYYQQNCQSGYCGHTPRQTLLYLPRNASYWIPVV